SSDIQLRSLIVWIVSQRLFEGVYRLLPGAGAVELDSIAKMAEHIHHRRERRFGMVVENLVNTNRFGLSFHDHRINLACAIGAAQMSQSLLTDQDVSTILLAGTFETGSEIYTIPDHCVIHPFRRTNVARHNLICVETDTDINRFLALRCSSAVVRAKLAHHGNRGTDGG